MTTGSYNLNRRVPTMGLYSGPYQIGPVLTKSWDGANQVTDFRVPPNVYPLYESKRTTVFYRKSFEIRKAIHYAWKFVPIKGIPAPSRESYQANHAGSKPVYSLGGGSGALIGFKIRYPIVREYVKTIRTPVTVTKTKLRKYRGGERPPKRARRDEHPYSASWNDNCNAVVSYTYPGIGNFSNASNSIISSYTVNSTWTSNDDLKLIDKLRTKVAGSSFNAGIALAESGEALRMITESSTKIYKALRAVKRGDVVSAANYLTGRKPLRNRANDARVRKSRKTIQQNWLELQYGWLPLVNDAFDGAQFLAHQLNVPIQQTLRVRREQPATVVWSGSDGWKYQRSICITRSSIKAKIYEQDTPKLSGLTDPAAVAWELVPWSFVVDWFIPIGSYLSARGLSQSLTGTFVTTKKVWEDHSGFIPYGQPINGAVLSGSPYLRKGSIVRSISSSLQVPLPSWKPLSKVASWLHTANAVALVTSFKK